MSVPVQLESLRAEVEREGDAAFLVTVGEQAAPHVVSVRVGWVGDRLTVGAGRRSARNVADRPSVTLLWPTRQDGGLSLLVDGAGEVHGEALLITPTSAIRHRSVVEPDGARRSDCAELPVPDGMPG